jgi:hypothetical protein
MVFIHERHHHAGDRLGGHTGIADLQELTDEEAGRVGTPCLGEGEERVAHRPREHRGVVDGDDRADADLPPPQPLGAAAHPRERQRRRAAELVADAVVEQQERDAGGQQRDQVGDDEGPAAVLVGDVGEAPDVAESDGRADGRQDEDPARRERAAALLLLDGGGRAHQTSQDVVTGASPATA